MTWKFFIRLSFSFKNRFSVYIILKISRNISISWTTLTNLLVVEPWAVHSLTTVIFPLVMKARCGGISPSQILLIRKNYFLFRFSKIQWFSPFYFKKTKRRDPSCREKTPFILFKIIEFLKLNGYLFFKYLTIYN